VTGPGYFARLALLGLILAANGFFAAAEVSLLSVRESRLRHLAGEGHAGARMALALLANPEKLLSVTQVGVTLASLGLGWAGEDTLYEMFMALFHPLLTPATESLLHGVCFTLAFLLMTYCHVVIGEVVPKNLAIDKAARLALVVAPVLTVISRIVAPFVLFIEKSASAISRMLGVSSGHHRGGHSTEELKFIVTASRHSAELPESQEEMIHRILDLKDLYVRELMKPRRDIVSVPVDASLDQILETMVSSQHSRLPVWQGAQEHIVGIVFFKDMLHIWQERRSLHRTPPPFHLHRVMRKPLMVPETKPAPQMLDEFRQGHTHMAMVVDEFGTVTGILTIEDILEEIVGEIEDEFDEKVIEPDETAVMVEVDGAMTVRDLESSYGIELPANAGFETLAGYMLFRLGHIPSAGEQVEFEDRTFTVVSMERNRIAQVRIDKKAPDAGA
jgi:putative hemolysin